MARRLVLFGAPVAAVLGGVTVAGANGGDDHPAQTPTTVTTVPVDEAAKLAPAPGEAPTAQQSLTEADAQDIVANDTYSLYCTDQSDRVIVVQYTPVLDANGQPEHPTPDGFVPSIVKDRMPDATCTTHNEVSAAAEGQ
jgi:hypothetical protein